MQTLTAATVAFFVAAIACAQNAFERPVTVPLLDDGPSFRVPVTLFGSEHFLLVDTGTSATALDTSYRAQLGEPVSRFGEQDFYRSPKILLAQTALGTEKVFCADLKMFSLVTGEPCDGILGMDFLKD